MIVISGVLLLVAVVFLIIGLFGPLAWVYASIGVSVLSFIFLLLGVRQRKGTAAAPEAADAPALPTAPVATPAMSAGGEEEVTVVAPRPTPAVDEPASALAGSVEPAAATSRLRGLPEPADSDDAEEAEVVPTTGAGRASRKTAATTSSLAKSTPATRAAAKKTTARKTAAKTTTAKTAAAKTGTAAKKTAAKTTTAKKTAAKTTTAKTTTARKTTAKKTTAKKTTPRRTT